MALNLACFWPAKFFEGRRVQILKWEL